MQFRTAAALGIIIALSACAQTQSVGLTGIGSEGTGFGRGAVSSGVARTAPLGPAPSAATLRAALAAAPIDTYVGALGGEAVEIRRVAVGDGFYAVLARPGGAGAVSSEAERIFWLNAQALTNCRQTGPFLTDPARGSVAALACDRGI